MLDGFDLSNAKFRRLFSEIVYSNDEHRSSVDLQLARGRTHQHQRMLLTRDERRLPVAHHGLLLWIGSSKAMVSFVETQPPSAAQSTTISRLRMTRAPQTRQRYNRNRKAWARAKTRRPHRGNTVSPQDE